jgi:hypothetical protein
MRRSMRKTSWWGEVAINGKRGYNVWRRTR